MEKRYQVFVSSTFEDLREERKAVMQALLELDCIPAGMELFPASSEEQWSLIKRVIDDSDYYVLILAGRYGSCNEKGMGYTEMEYRYALDTGKPIISFLHEAPGKISADKTEDTPEGKEKLEQFRTLTKKRLVKGWTTQDNLALAVTASMAKLPKQFPAVGWVKGDQAADADMYKRLAILEQENAELRRQIEKSGKVEAEKIKELAQGDDALEFCIYGYDEYSSEPGKDAIIHSTWNEVFRIIAPKMMGGCSEDSVKQMIANHFLKNSVVDDGWVYMIVESDYQRIKIQLMKLQLIKLGQQPGMLELTEHGEDVITDMIVERRPVSEDAAGDAVPV